METGAPVASGATLSTALENSFNAAFEPDVSLGNTWMRAVPFFATQSHHITSNNDANVTCDACNDVANCISSVFKPKTSAAAAVSRSAFEPFASLSSAAANPCASCAAGDRSLAAVRSAAAVAFRLATTSASDRGGLTVNG